LHAPSRKEQAEAPPEEKRLTVLEHLEELRERLIKSLLALALSTAVSLLFTSRLLRFLTAPAGIKLVFLRPTEMFVTYIRVALIAGAAMAMPVIAYQFVRFVLPALHPHERRYLYLLVPGSAFSFVTGLAFAYYAMLPFAIRYLLSFGGDIAEARWSVSEYISFVFTLLFATGLCFEMPLAVFFLAKVGLVKAQVLSRYRRHAIVAIAVIAAVITPTPDPFNMLVVMLPLLLLYEVGVWLAKLAG